MALTREILLVDSIQVTFMYESVLDITIQH